MVIVWLIHSQIDLRYAFAGSHQVPTARSYLAGQSRFQKQILYVA
jgi:hypothetical protein